MQQCYMVHWGLRGTQTSMPQVTLPVHAALQGRNNPSMRQQCRAEHRRVPRYYCRLGTSVDEAVVWRVQVQRQLGESVTA
jgi:hypothetical protein